MVRAEFDDTRLEFEIHLEGKRGSESGKPLLGSHSGGDLKSTSATLCEHLTRLDFNILKTNKPRKSVDFRSLCWLSELLRTNVGFARSEGSEDFRAATRTQPAPNFDIDIFGDEAPRSVPQ